MCLKNILKTSTFDIFHDEKTLIVLDEGFIHLHDVFVPAQCLYFPGFCEQRFKFAATKVLHPLDRYITTFSSVRCAPHDPVTAITEKL